MNVIAWLIERIFLKRSDGTTIDPATEYYADWVLHGTRSGYAFITSTGKKSAQTPQGFLRGTFFNPGPREVRIYKLVLFQSTGTPNYAEIYINPTNGLPAGTANVNNNSGGSLNTSPVVFKFDNVGILGPALGGGIDTGIDIGFADGRTEIVFEGGFVVMPGITIGINIPYTGGPDIVMTVQWTEEV